jgi:ATP-dependent Lhr-like helicase
MTACGRVPSDEDILIERCRDELGDWRICVLTPFGSRVHAPWCMAVTARLRAGRGMDIETMWSDDGFVIRLPDTEEPLETEALLPSAAELKDLVLRQLGATSLFAAKFREAAGRALLIPRRRPGQRTPLWQQRKRASDLMAVASRFPSFPILLETYRECMREALDIASAIDVLKRIERGAIRVTTFESAKPSPFASALLFNYIANYIYEGDAPLAERRAQALSIDQSQLEQILGNTDFRELLDKAAIDEVEAQLQSLDSEYHARHSDAVHDLLLKLGDLSEDELRARAVTPAVAATIHQLAAAGRAIAIAIAGQVRFIPAEYAARYRDALGIRLPAGIAAAFLEPQPGALAALARRYARTHAPFTRDEFAHRYSLPPESAALELHRLHEGGKLLEGEFRPGGVHREWCDPEVLQQIRRKTLSRLRREVVPAEPFTFARFLYRWQGVIAPRKGMEALLDAIETLQGAELIASDLEREILPARVAGYRPAALDALLASGDVVWVGREPIGARDGRVSLYLAEALAPLTPPGVFNALPDSLSERARAILDFLSQHGASFQAAIQQGTGGGFPQETVDALWELVWAGLITNDTYHPVRSRIAAPVKAERTHTHFAPGSPGFVLRQRARNALEGFGQGRWSLVSGRLTSRPTPAEWSAAAARQLLLRNGIVMRESAAVENLSGGYPSVYPALKIMEESGSIRRGMFVSGMGAAQFAMPAAIDMLRSLRPPHAPPEAVHLAASDPANPYGGLLPWTGDPVPAEADAARHNMARAAGASVILIDGRLAAFFRRHNPAIQVFLPADEPERSQFALALAQKLAAVAIRFQTRRSGLLITTIDGEPAASHPLGPYLGGSGFVSTAAGYQMRRVSPVIEDQAEEDGEEPGEEDAPAGGGGATGVNLPPQKI